MEAQVLDAYYNVVTVDGVLSPAECDALIGRTEACGFDPAPVTTPSGFVMMPRLRNNTRVILDDVELARALWARVERFAPRPPRAWRAAGLNERFRFYRYDPGQKFDWHYDGAFERSPRDRSEFTFMVYLNDGYGGGETEFEGGPSVVPVRGRAVFFTHNVLHRGAPVTFGRKYVLRSDVMCVPA